MSTLSSLEDRPIEGVIDCVKPRIENEANNLA